MYPRIDILVEEKSMVPVIRKIIEETVSDRWIEGTYYFIEPAKGKSDFKRKIPNTAFVAQQMSNYCKTGLILIRDNDSANCKAIKAEHLALCGDSPEVKKLCRIVCEKLESWFFGDIDAINNAYHRFSAINNITDSTYSNTDKLNNADDLLCGFLGTKNKVEIASRIAPHLNIYNNRSESFNQTVRGIKEFFNAFEQYLPQ